MRWERPEGRAGVCLRLFQTTDAASAISQVLPTTARETVIPFHGRGGCDRAVGVSPSPQGKPEFELRTGPLLPDTTASLTGHRRGIPPQHAHAAWSESAVGWEFRRLAVGVESTVFHGTDCLRGEGAGRGEMVMLRSLHGWGAPCG